MRVGLVLSGLFVAAALASTGLAQSAPGRIVQSSDGTLYVLRDGARFAIVAEPIEDEELGTFAEGGTIGAAELLQTGVAAAPPAGGVTLSVPRADDAAPAAPVVTNPAPPGNAKPSAIGPAQPTEGTQPRFVSVLGNAPGKMASVTVQSAPGASCSIGYLTPTRTAATAAGMGQQTVGPSGVVTWSFLIGAATQPGSGSVSVTCGTATITSPLPIEGLSK